ncbi:MAG: hypothetical protein KME31_26495 [Tolypothrix carrinoi HA7290-LM1]|nr:hypothetical protein [Tolypothrix carrinoi HA7290-LM1]
MTVGRADGRCFNGGNLTSGFATTNRRYRQPRCLDSPQRTASPTHCLPLALASPFGRRQRWLTAHSKAFKG